MREEDGGHPSSERVNEEEQARERPSQTLSGRNAREAAAKWPYVDVERRLAAIPGATQAGHDRKLLDMKSRVDENKDMRRQQIFIVFIRTH